MHIGLKVSAFLLGLVVGTADAGKSANGAPLTLVAAATDANAAVFDDGGALHRVKVGEKLPGLPLTLATVRDARVTLDADARLEGRRLSVTLAVGERVDPATLAALADAYRPVPITEVTVQALPRRDAPKPDRSRKP